MKTFGVRALGAAFILLTGCSTFHRDWEQATHGTANTDSINGAWTGNWHSDVNGHHGSLRCVVTQISPTTFRAHYRAHFLKVFRYTYLATLNGHETNGTYVLEGTANLGKLAGGVYTYKGAATQTNFTSTYASKYDHGSYELKRP
jgi:hypothetical protein